MLIYSEWIVRTIDLEFSLVIFFIVGFSEPKEVGLDDVCVRDQALASETPILTKHALNM